MIKAIVLFFIAACFVVGYYGEAIESVLGPNGIKIVLGIMGALTVVIYIIKDISNSGGGAGRHSGGGGYTVDELEEFDMMDED